MHNSSRKLGSDRPSLALSWMALSALGFSAMAIFVKRLAPAIPQFELVFFRAAINFSVILLIMLARREKLVPLTGDRNSDRTVVRVLLLRGLAGFGGVTCLFYSIGHLPLPIAMLLGWTSPLFALVFSHLFLHEKILRRAFVSIGIAFVGLVILLKPDFKTGLAVPLVPVLVGLVGAAFSGGAYVAVRAATARLGTNLIILYFMGISVILSLPLIVSSFQAPAIDQALELLLLGLFATLGQVAMTEGYRYAPAGLVSPMSLLTAALSAVFGWLVFDERLAVSQWLGLCAIGVGILSLTWRSRDSLQSASRVKLRYE